MAAPARVRSLVALLATFAMAAAMTLALPGSAVAAPPAASPSNVRQACVAPAKKGQMQCLALARTDVRSGTGVVPNAAPSGYGPADLANAYDLPASGGQHATVAIIDAYDDPNAEADLGVYRAQYGLPPCTSADGCFTKLAQDGSTNYPAPAPPLDDWTAEISLDLDMVSAVCPACHIILVEANQPTMDDLGTAVNQAVAHGAQYVSNSYGGFEDPSDTDADTKYFDHPGVVITASSGDRSYGTSYPAASQYVTAVGGTSLLPDSGTSRGWSESVWHNLYGGPGSGCSTFDAKPSWQADSGCARRSIADVSAVADPLTGVAVYDSWGGNTGWAVYGGTSASSPIVAGAYALAGLPVAGEHPASYPYAHASNLNDVTTGDNGTFCDPTYLCIAGPGYDGPTGLGTPAGVDAFKSADAHGQISGTVTDASNGHPVAGAHVDAGTGTATTRADGTYALALVPGTYDVSVSAYGYQDKTASAVTVSDGGSATFDAALAAKQIVTLSGAVTDGSGHGWPLPAKVSVTGTPLPPVETDPYTGRYSLQVPADSTYTVHAAPLPPGYAGDDEQVTVGADDTQQNVALKVDAEACNAPGYAYTYKGLAPEPFTSTAGPPTGWTVTTTQGDSGWVFNDPNAQGNTTGGDGNFAVVPEMFLGVDKHEDTTLTSPAVDLTGIADPVVGLDADYFASNTQVGSIDVSADGGTTWSNVWQFVGSYGRIVQGHQSIDIADVAGGKPNVRVRFNFTAYIGQQYWEIDNVNIGARGCSPVHGGLVAGQVLDANTHTAVDGATVTRVDGPTDTAASDAGFYSMFVPVTGKHGFSAAHRAYSSATKSVTVTTNSLTRADFSLRAGRLTASALSVGKTVRMGSTATAKFTLTNTGTAPANVTLDEQPGGMTMLDAQANPAGAPLQVVKAATSIKPHAATARAAAKAQRSDTPYAGPWVDLPNLPSTVMDNGVARADDGTIYSVGGTINGAAPTAQGFAYDPSTRVWSPIPDAPAPAQAAATAMIGGQLILAGGWGAGGSSPGVQIYDPSSKTWKTGAKLPTGRGGMGAAALDGKVYVVGGCAGSCDTGMAEVDVYDPSTNAWKRMADYPAAVAWLACGAVNGDLVCAGGVDPRTLDSTTAVYAYSPRTNTWTKTTDLPYDVWGSAYSTANGQLLISGGAVQNGFAITNQGVAFSMTGSDPSTGVWSPLPNSNNAVYRGGGACGIDKIGGAPEQFDAVPFAEELPGYDQCGAGNVPWLSATPGQATLQPGASVTVQVTLDASDLGIVDQPGSYVAKLGLQADTPYWVNPVTVTMTANPPTTWGKIAGTVSGLSCDGGAAPIMGGTVQIDSWAQSYTLKTDSAGGYALWLDKRNNPLTVIAAKDGFVPQVHTVRITPGATVTANVTLRPDAAC